MEKNKNFGKPGRSFYTLLPKADGFLGFTLADFIFIGVSAAIMLAIGGLLFPLHAVKIFGAKAIGFAFPYGFLIYIVLYKVRKPGTLLLLSLMLGIPLAFRPVMLFSFIIPALILEIICLIIFKNYRKTTPKLLASALFVPLQTPAQWFYMRLISGKVNNTIIVGGTLNISLIISFTVVLAIIGAGLGFIIAKEFKYHKLLKLNDFVE